MLIGVKITLRSGEWMGKQIEDGAKKSVPRDIHVKPILLAREALSPGLVKNQFLFLPSGQSLSLEPSADPRRDQPTTQKLSHPSRLDFSLSRISSRRKFPACVRSGSCFRSPEENRFSSRPGSASFCPTEASQLLASPLVRLLAFPTEA